jgi:hypothetical protein
VLRTESLVLKIAFTQKSRYRSHNIVKQQLRQIEMLILLLAMLVSTSKGASADDSRRQLQQQTLIYRANYTAEFQYWRSSTCDGDVPILQVSCFGQGMTTPNTSDTTIVCTKLQEPQVPNGTTYECRNTCNETTTSACSDIYLAEGLIPNIFGSIRFMCESDNVREVEAYVAYLGGDSNGTCAASATDSSVNYHIVRLGVSCPVGSSRGYVYDDTYFECRGLGKFLLDFAETDQDPDVYVCFSGDFCGAEACNFAFDDLSVMADVSSLIVDSCIETTETITSFPTVAPGPTPSFNYSVRFEASWAIRYNSDASIADCTSANPTLIVSCENDARIDYVNATDISMNCTGISNSELRCTGDISVTTNQFTSVFYVSTGIHPLIHAAIISNCVTFIQMLNSMLFC